MEACGSTWLLLGIDPAAQLGTAQASGHTVRLSTGHQKRACWCLRRVLTDLQTARLIVCRGTSGLVWRIKGCIHLSGAEQPD